MYFLDVDNRSDNDESTPENEDDDALEKKWAMSDFVKFV